MNHDALSGVIEDLKKQLEDANYNIDWHHKRLKEYNEKAIKLKETIAELESMKDEAWKYKELCK